MDHDVWWPWHETDCYYWNWLSCDRLTAVLLVTPVRTVTEAVTAETSDDAVDAISTGEERGGALRLDLS